MNNISPSINTNNITLGKGESFLGVNRNSYLPFGLLKTGQLNIKAVTQILKDSTSGINVPAFIAPIGSEATAKITVAEVSLVNLQKFMLASTPAAAAQAGGVTAAQLVTAKLGALIQLQAAGGIAQYKISTATKPVIASTGGSPITYTEGTDYTVNYDRGLIKILPTGTITDGEALTIGFTSVAYTNQTILSHTQAVFQGHFMFIGNVPYGSMLNLYGYCFITPNGSLNFADTDSNPIEMAFDLTFIPNTAYPTGSLVIADMIADGV